MSTTRKDAPSDTVPADVKNICFQSWITLVHAYGLVSRVLERELMAEQGISLAWFEALIRLRTAPGGRRRLSDLTQELIVSKASVTRLIDRMERAGLVRREPSDGDRRAVYAAITPTGIDTITRALPVHMTNVFESFSDRLTCQDLADLQRILDKIVRSHAGGRLGPTAG